jgi:hypothetical protein
MGRMIIKKNGTGYIPGRVENLVDNQYPIMCIPDVNGFSLNRINTDLKNYFRHDHYIVPWAVKGDILIQHYYRRIDDSAHFNKRILIQPMDGTVIRPVCIQEMNRYDVVVTPSSVGKRIMEKNGVTAPIYVIPNYYDDSEPSDYFKKSTKFTFYSESTGIYRKNITNLITNFIETFNGDDTVRLVLKIDPHRYRKILRSLGDMDNKVEITVITDELNQEDLCSVMSNIDCYVCVSYMEGFCIPLLNALRWNKKIIALDSSLSGYMDFLNDSNSYLIRYNRIPIHRKSDCLLIWTEDSEWEEPDYRDLRDTMRKVIHEGPRPVTDISQYSMDKVMKEYRKVFDLPL